MNKDRHYSAFSNYYMIEVVIIDIEAHKTDTKPRFCLILKVTTDGPQLDCSIAKHIDFG